MSHRNVPVPRDVLTFLLVTLAISTICHLINIAEWIAR